jgi:signal transduction histidine kinase
MRFQRHHTALVLASLVTVASFVGATAYTQRQMITLDALSTIIETNAVPSIEYLGRGGIRVKRVRQLIYDAIASPRTQTTSLSTARTELQALEHDIDRYLQLTPLPGERDLWTALGRDLDRGVNLARLVIDAADSSDVRAASLLMQMQAEPALDRATETMLAAMEFDVKESERLAREVRAVRRATTQRIVILDVLATTVALVAAAIAFRTSREHDRLLRKHNLLLNERVTDLDRFAGRVAHDILSPLDTVGVGLALVERSADSESRVHIVRARRSVQRVKQLVEGLLRFARAGATVDARSRCPVDVVLANVAADCLEPARESGIDVVVEPCQQFEVGASVGVLTSIVQNLVWNAIKYMGTPAVRQVIIRARAAADRVRIEVADTGSGISAELQTKMFEPFIRGSHNDVGGMGLGLATVKRLVEGHGGTVGVKSTVGVGTVFSVELPVPPK